MQNSNIEKQYLTDIEVGQLFGLHRCSIWRWVKRNGFPEPVKLSAGCVRWKRSDIEAWEKSRETR
jgi:prophage regulatory protein